MSSFHLLSEIFETSVRLSQTYFVVSEKLQKYVNYDKCCCGCFGTCRKLIYDDSTYEQWCIRHSIDVIIRCMVSIVVSIWVICFRIGVIVIVRNGQPTNTDKTSLEYSIINGATELVYFLIAFHIHRRWTNHNIIYIGYAVWKCHRKMFLLAWIVGVWISVNSFYV